MIIYIISIILLLAIIGANFGVPIQKRVMAMSILSICIIMLNFINEIDLVISPPIYGLLTSHGSYKIHRLQFTKEPFQSDLEKDATQQQRKTQIQLLNLHPNPLNKEEIKFLDKLKNSYYDDLILHVEGLQEQRLQTLFIKFMRQVQNDSIKFNKKIIATVMPLHPNEDQHKIRYILPSLSESQKHFVLLLQEPTLEMMSFLQAQYLLKQISIIFLKLPTSPLIHPITKYIQTLELNPIYSQLFLKNSNLNIVQQCNKYRKLTYNLYLQSLVTPMIDLCSALPSSLETQCVKKFMKNQKDMIPFSLVKGCWLGQVPKGIKIKNGFVTVEKDYFWSGKTDKSMFIVQSQIKQNQEL